MTDVSIADAVRESTTLSGQGERFTFTTDGGRRIDGRVDWGLVEAVMIERPVVTRIFLMPPVVKG